MLYSEVELGNYFCVVNPEQIVFFADVDELGIVSRYNLNVKECDDP
jgi:hypothetical protein